MKTVFLSSINLISFIVLFKKTLYFSCAVYVTFIYFLNSLSELFDMNSQMRPDYALNFVRKSLESPILKQSQEALVWVQVRLFILNKCLSLVWSRISMFWRHYIDIDILDLTYILIFFLRLFIPVSYTHLTLPTIYSV